MDGMTLGGYRILSELGSGGMGKVHLAESMDAAAAVKPGQRVALKMVHPHLLEDPGFTLRFLREGEMGRRVQHPNVVRTLDVVSTEQGGRPVRFLVMEFVEGQTLFDVLRDMGRLPDDLCRFLGLHIARGLAAIHAEGIVHRDLKPENVLVTPDQQVKIMDLGVARLSDELIRLSVTGAFVGSPRYAAPEQFLGGDQPLDGRSDLYSLGLILHELATGDHPLPADDFPTAMRRCLQDSPPRAGVANPQVSSFLEELVLSLLSKDPGQRPSSAEELVRTLDEGEESPWWAEHSRAVRRAAAAPMRRPRMPRETAVYGRDADIEFLQRAWDAVREGEGRVVLLEGEAGIGKTRLVDEFVERLRREETPFHFLFGGWPPGGAATSTGAFTAAFRDHFGESGLDTAVREPLAAVPLLAPAFAALLRGEPSPAGALPLEKGSLQTAFVHAVRGLASACPVILLVDDLHFAPEEGRELFAAMAHAAAATGVLLVGTARPGLPSAWRSDLERLPHASARTLGRLDTDDIAVLLADTLGSCHLGRELAERIERKSAGNPFFVFEIIRGLREGRFLRETGAGTWETADLLEDIRLPDSLTDLVRARLDALDREDRDLLDVAACCGFEFDAGLIADALGEQRIPLLRRLANIEKRHRLVHSSGRKFVFEHHQFREVVYEDMPEALREEYHGVLAEALERRESARERGPETLPGALAHALCEQFLKGGRPFAAERYLEGALDHLAAVYLNEAAVALVNRALSEPGLLRERRRIEVLVRLARRLDYLGRRAAQRQALDEAMREADHLGDPGLRAMVRARMGGHLGHLVRLDEAAAVLEEALPLAREAGDRETEGHALKNLGIVLRLAGRLDEAEARLGELLDLGEGDVRTRAAGLGALGNALWARGDLEGAQRHFEEHRDLAHEAGDRRGEAIALGNLAGVRFMLGRYDEARRQWEQQLEMARGIGDRRAEGIATGNLGNLEASMGRYGDALDRLERNLVLASEVGNRVGIAYSLQALSMVLMDLGALPAAARRLDELCVLAEDLGMQRFWSQGLIGRAQLAHLEGRWDDVRECLSRADAMLSEGEDEVQRAWARLTAGRALLDEGRQEDAAAALDEAVSLAVQRDRPEIEAVALAARATLEGGDAEAAMEAFERHRRRLENRHRLAARWYLYRATGDRKHLELAHGHLRHVRDHAPGMFHDTLVERVPLHRAVRDAFEATRAT